MVYEILKFPFLYILNQHFDGRRYLEVVAGLRHRSYASKEVMKLKKRSRDADSQTYLALEMDCPSLRSAADRLEVAVESYR